MNHRVDRETTSNRHGAQIRLRWNDGVAIMDITGHFAEDAESTLELVYQEACALGAAQILLNFDGQGLITSAGYGLIIKLVRRTRQKGQELRIAQPSERTRRMFQIMGLTHAVAIHAAEHEALQAFQKIGDRR